MLGCGQTNHLQSITLGASAINGTATTTQAGFYSLQGNGGTIQLQAIGNYTDGKTKDLSNEVTYSMIVDPHYNQNAFGGTLLPPCFGPCQSSSQGTVEYNATGLVTSVEPATCTWLDVGTQATPSYFYVGDYQATATFEGITSQPVYIPVASSSGSATYPYPNGTVNNPTEQCGPEPL
jgi:hypothetical protein